MPFSDYVLIYLSCWKSDIYFKVQLSPTPGGKRTASLCVVFNMLELRRLCNHGPK